MPRNGKHTPNRGRIYPGGLLTVEGVKTEIGIGKEQLRLARKSGLVRQYPCGGTGYYKTDEIIAWILSGGGNVMEARKQRRELAS